MTLEAKECLHNMRPFHENARGPNSSTAALRTAGRLAHSFDAFNTISAFGKRSRGFYSLPGIPLHGFLHSKHISILAGFPSIRLIKIPYAIFPSSWNPYTVYENLRDKATPSASDGRLRQVVLSGVLFRLRP
jgi:hypothetical protein